MTTLETEQQADIQTANKANTTETPTKPSLARELMMQGLYRTLSAGVFIGTLVAGAHYLKGHPNLVGDHLGSQLSSLATQIQRTPQMRELNAKLAEKQRACEAASSEARRVRESCSRIVPHVETATQTQLARGGLCMQQAQFAATMATITCGF